MKVKFMIVLLATSVSLCVKAGDSGSDGSEKGEPQKELVVAGRKPSEALSSSPMTDPVFQQRLAAHLAVPPAIAYEKIMSALPAKSIFTEIFPTVRPRAANGVGLGAVWYVSAKFIQALTGLSLLSSLVCAGAGGAYYIGVEEICAEANALDTGRKTLKPKQVDPRDIFVWFVRRRA